MSSVPTLTPNKPLIVRLEGPTDKFPICITFPPTPGVRFSLPTPPYTNFGYIPEFEPGLCFPHPDEKMTEFQTRVESVAGGAYVALTIDLANEIDVIAVAIFDDHPYLAQSKYNFDILAKKATEIVRQALREGTLVLKESNDSADSAQPAAI